MSTPSENPLQDSSSPENKAPKRPLKGSVAVAVITISTLGAAGFSVMKSTSLEEKVAEWRERFYPDHVSKMMEARLTEFEATNDERFLPKVELSNVSEQIAKQIELLIGPMETANSKQALRMESLARSIQKGEESVLALSQMIENKSTNESDIQSRLAELKLSFEEYRSELGGISETHIDEAIESATQQLGKKVAALTEAARNEIEELKSALIAFEDRRAQAIELAHQKELDKARGMLLSPSDFNRALGLHLAIEVDPIESSKVAREMVASTNPTLFPTTTETLLTLGIESDQAEFRELFFDTVSGKVNEAWHPFGLEFVSRMDFAGRHRSLAQRALEAALSPTSIDDPDQFSAVLKIFQALLPDPSDHPTSVALNGEARSSFCQFFANYLGARIIGFPATGSSFPVTDFAELNPGGRWPRLSTTNRERLLFLASVARRLGVAKGSLAITTKLARYVQGARPRDEAVDLLIEILKTVSGQDLGKDWSRWEKLAESGL